jgi:hypothetical protein
VVPVRLTVLVREQCEYEYMHNDALTTMKTFLWHRVVSTVHCPFLRLVSPQPRLVSSFELGLSGRDWSLATKWR